MYVHFTVSSILSAVGLLLLWLVVQFVLIPYLRVEIRRRRSRNHTPQPEEIWTYEGGILYIDAVGPTGVEVFMIDPKTRTPYKWKDTWPEWQQRLRVKVLWYTGQRRPLGNG